MKRKENGFASNTNELAAGAPMPADTLGGVMQKIEQVRAKQPQSDRQCPATFTTLSTGNTVFCEHREGHEGEHKGYRKRWT